jgi:hypothetical protein
MLGFTTFAKWYRSANSIGNELEARLKKAEEEVRNEWNALVKRVETLEQQLKTSLTRTQPPPPPPAPPQPVKPPPLPPTPTPTPTPMPPQVPPSKPFSY